MAGMRLVNLNRCGKAAFAFLAMTAVALLLSKNYIMETTMFGGGADDSRFNSILDALVADHISDHPMDVLKEFYKMADLMGIEAIVIEPQLLFDSLDIADKDLLLQKEFSITEPSSSHNITIISLALIGNSSKVIEENFGSKKKVSKIFEHWSASTKVSIDGWVPRGFRHEKSFSSHHFFRCRNTLIHGVVFFRRSTFYWHAALPPDTPLPVPWQDLTFVNASAYERFTATPTKLDGVKPMHFKKPVRTTRFLKEIESSQFIECDPWRASSLKKSDMEKTPRYNTLKGIFSESLGLLKKYLHPQLNMFFIFAGTLLGWYRQCDIIPYTSDVDFASWATDIGSEEFWIKTFGPGKNILKLGELMGLPEKGFELSFRLYGNKVDLFFIYRNESMSWATGHRPSKGYYFSYKYPTFSLCSGELVGHKVLVPCTAEEVIKAEYGPLWRKPATSWNYEYHPRNMGERQFWTAEERKRASKYFS